MIAIKNYLYSVFFIKIHEYRNTGERPFADLAPNWVNHRCIHCNDVSGLNGWQIREMPKEMSKCPSGKLIFKPLNFIFGPLMGGYNCLKK